MKKLYLKNKYTEKDLIELGFKDYGRETYDYPIVGYLRYMEYNKTTRQLAMFSSTTDFKGHDKYENADIISEYLIDDGLKNILNYFERIEGE